MLLLCVIEVEGRVAVDEELVKTVAVALVEGVFESFRPRPEGEHDAQDDGKPKREPGAWRPIARSVSNHPRAREIGAYRAAPS